MPYVRDSVWGDVRLSEGEKKLTNTPLMQRLHYVRQLGTTYLVYPCAQHTRWTHAVGACHIMGKMVDVLPVGSEHVGQTLRVAALFHDVGHPPFSHVLEGCQVFKESGKNHEKAGIEKLRKMEGDSEFQSALREAEVDLGEVVEILEGTDPKVPPNKRGWSNLISGPIDADRFDYLTRDARACGVNYVSVDSRVLELIKWDQGGGEIYVDEKGIQPAISLLVSRLAMYQIVLNHHVRRITTTMLCRALEAVCKGPSRPSEEELDMVYDMRDDQFLQWLGSRDCEYTKDIVDRFYNRKLFKMCYKLTPFQIDDPSKRSEMEALLDNHPKLLERERVIRERLPQKLRAVNEDRLLVSAEKPKNFQEENLKVKIGGKFKAMTDLGVGKALEEAYRQSWSIQVYADCTGRDDRDEIASVCKDVFGIGSSALR